MIKKIQIKFSIVFLILLFLVFAPIFDGIFIPPIQDNSSLNNSDIVSTPLIYGTGSSPVDLDPIDSWDSASNDVIRQVCEPLFFYNLSDPLLPRLNWLAASYSYPSDVILEVNIRTGISFHDGTVMDATACAWNFDRLIYHMNHTGQLPAGGHRAKIHSLYEFPDGFPIMNRTEVIDTDTFRIHLNGPYTQLLAAMSYVSCSVLSPTSTPFNQFLDKAIDDLVGTGPYMYDYYIADTEVRFTRFDDYWGSPANTGPAQFGTLIFDIIDDSTTRNYAMLNGDIDYLSGSMADLFDDFRTSPTVTFYEDPGSVSLGISYLAMNNDVYSIAEGDTDDYIAGVNITWRKAISFAINNTFMTEEMYDGQMVRAYCWISPGYGDFFDPNLPSYLGTVPDEGDREQARNIIKADMAPVNSIVAGLPITPGNPEANDAAWEAVELVIFNYSYNTDNWFRADLFEALDDWLSLIGINVLDGGTDWEYFLYRAYGYVPGRFDQLQLFWVGWGPDYLDPINMIQPLLSNISSSNSAQINNPMVENLIETYNTDLSLSYNERKWIIWNLTYICTQVGYFHVYGFHAKVFSVHAADLYEVPYNVLGNFWAYPIKTLYNVQISSSDNIVFFEGETGYNVTWNLTATQIDNPKYYTYRDNDLLSSDNWTSGDSISANLDGLPIGIYTYRILVENSQRSLENNVTVTVLPRITISHPEDISYTEGSIGNNISWTINALNPSNPIYYIYRNSSLIHSDNYTSGVPVVINVDGLSNGTYSFQIIAYNGPYFVEDIVLVHVIGFLKIEITHPSDITYYEGETGHHIIWTITDGSEENAHYTVYSDAGLIQTGSWEIGSPIIINVDGLSVGDHLYSIQVHNSYESIVDQVNVKVLPTSAAIPGFPLMILISFALITVIILRKKVKHKSF